MPHVSNQTGSRFVWEKHRPNPNNPSEYQTFPKDKDMNDPNAESLWVSANKKDSDTLKATTQPGTTNGGTSATGEGDISGIKLPGVPGADFETSWATWKEAYDAAQARGLRVGYVEIGDDGAATPISGDYDITMKNSEFFINPAREPTVTGGKSYSIQVSPINGDIIAINRADPQDMQVVEKAPTSPPMGSDKVGELIPNGDGSFTQPYEIIDSQGRSRIHYVKVAAANVTPTEKDIITFNEADGGGRLIPLGGGKYTYEPPEDEPFTTSPSDVVPLPNQNGSLIKTSANQYQFVRDTFDPGRKVDETGREYLQQIDGSWSELAPRFEPELIRADGMNLFQQRSGQVTQLSAATMDDVITQALIDGDVDKALAFQDFRDRPTAQEAFNTALEFARSPADQRIISSIARGITPVQPPPEGTIQRVGPQPDFLIQAYQDFQRRTQAGRAPTGEEISAATEDPTLQARLESIANKDRREEEKHQLFITSEEGKQRRAQEAFETQEATRAAESAAKIAASGGTENTETGAEAVVETDDGTTTEADALRAEAELEVRQAIEANQKIWDSLSEDQKALFGGSGDTVPENFKSLSQGQVNLHLELAKLPPAPSPDVPEVQTPSVEQPVVLDIPEAAPRAPEISSVGEEASYQPVTGASLAADVNVGRINEDSATVFMSQNEADTIAASLGTAIPNVAQQFNITPTPAPAPVTEMATRSDPGMAGTLAASATDPFGGGRGRMFGRAGGGTVQPGEMTVVGENGPEIAMMPPGTHILPLGKATKQDIRAAQATGRAYQNGGIVFDDLAPGLQQLQRGRPITPPRGYLFQQGGLTLPSMQALQNLTPTVRESFYGMHGDIGISPADFRQELQTATPRGTRLPTSRMLPLGRRGVR